MDRGDTLLEDRGLIDGEVITCLKRDLGVDVVFPVLHGAFGEDGTIQGLLELADLPYVGAGVLASAVGMDKATMKLVFAAKGLPICDYAVVLKRDWQRDERAILQTVVNRLGFPVFVKPANLGSSVGITKAHDAEELWQGVALAFEQRCYRPERGEHAGQVIGQCDGYRNRRSVWKASTKRSHISRRWSAYSFGTLLGTLGSGAPGTPCGRSSTRASRWMSYVAELKVSVTRARLPCVSIDLTSPTFTPATCTAAFGCNASASASWAFTVMSWLQGSEMVGPWGMPLMITAAMAAKKRTSVTTPVITGEPRRGVTALPPTRHRAGWSTGRSEAAFQCR